MLTGLQHPFSFFYAIYPLINKNARKMITDAKLKKLDKQRKEVEGEIQSGIYSTITMK